MRLAGSRTTWRSCRSYSESFQSEPDRQEQREYGAISPSSPRPVDTSFPSTGPDDDQHSQHDDDDANHAAVLHDSDEFRSLFHGERDGPECALS
jgi:hypothetical protein